MSKRKFEEISKSKPSSANKLSSSQRAQQQRFLGYLENGQTQLVGGLKLARGFERQKLGRRQKDARAKETPENESKEVDRINAEIAVLKALDLTTAAEFYIARTLCRIKSIASCPLLPEQVRQLGQGRSPYQTPAEANVTARLFKSTAVKNAMSGIEEQARALLNVQRAQNGSKAQGKRIASEGSQEWDGLSDTAPDVPAALQAAGDIERSEGDDSEHTEHTMNLHDDEDYDIYNDRLASDIDTDSGQSDTADRFDRKMTNRIDRSGSSPLPSPPPRDPKSDSKSSEARPKATSKTTFLPTLATGYISGSESDSFASDTKDTSEKPKQRNRMGQQARRALAEQQYGPAAKHLRDQKGKKAKGRQSRNTGWDLKRGATDGRGRGRGRGSFWPDAVARDGAKEERKPAPRTKDDTGPLHPSWIAKKKLKEQQNSGVLAFQGKKVTFD